MLCLWKTHTENVENTLRPLYKCFSIVRLFNLLWYYLLSWIIKISKHPSIFNRNFSSLNRSCSLVSTFHEHQNLDRKLQINSHKNSHPLFLLHPQATDFSPSILISIHHITIKKFLVYYMRLLPYNL